MQSFDLVRSFGFLVAGVGMLVISRSAKRLPETRRGGGVFNRTRWASARVLRTEYSGNGYQLYKIGAVLMLLGIMTMLITYIVK